MRKNKIINTHFEKIKCVLEDKRLIDDAIAFPSYIGFSDSEIIKAIVYYIKNAYKLYYREDASNPPWNLVWKRSNMETYNMYLFNYYIFAVKPLIINKIIKKELPSLPKKYYFWMGLYINDKYIVKYSDIKTYIYARYLKQLSHKLKHHNLHNLHEVYKYAVKYGMLKDFDKKYIIITKNAGKIFREITKLYKHRLDNKQFVKYYEKEGKYYDFPSNINYYLDRLPNYSDRECIEKEVIKKLGLK
jgi:hypothetical protein